MTDVNAMVAVAEKYPPASANLGELPDEPEVIDPQDPEITSGSKTKRPWRIETADAAEWALRRKAEEDQEVARIVALGEERKRFYCRQIDTQVAAATRGRVRLSAFFESLLLEWMSRARSQILKGKAKSAKFLFGTLGWKASREKLVYNDPAVALAWAREQGVESGLYRVDFNLEKDAIKAYAKKHEVVPPGARWEGNEDVPYVEAQAPTAANTPMQIIPQDDGVTP